MRELASLPKNNIGNKIKSQFCFTIPLYIVACILLLPLFLLDIAPRAYAIWILLLLLLEHVNHEISRLHIALKNQLTSSVMLFFRAGLWPFAYILTIYLDPQTNNLSNLLTFWAISSLIGIAVGIARLAKMHLGGWRAPPDWAWVYHGAKLALPLLLGTLCIRGIYTIDRYLIEQLGSLNMLAAYTLFIGVAQAQLPILDAGIFAYSCPNLVKAWRDNSRHKFVRESKRLFFLTLIVITIFTALTTALLPTLLEWIGRPIYTDNSAMYHWLSAATALYALSFVPHYLLYAQDHDAPLSQSPAIGLITFILVVATIAQDDPTLAVPIGLFFGSLVVLLWKALAYIIKTPKEFRILQAPIWPHN